MLKSIFKAAVFGFAAGAANAVWRAGTRQAPAAARPESMAPAAPHAPVAPGTANVQAFEWPLAQLARFDHDLRTPIGTIGNALEWLRAEPTNAESAQEAHAVIERQVRRLTTLTSELHELVTALEARQRAS